MMYNHPHPGAILWETVFSELNISITEAATRLGVTRATLSRVLHGHAKISSDLAVRLERAGVGTARSWMRLQANYDVQQAMKRAQPKVKRLVAA